MISVKREYLKAILFSLLSLFVIMGCDSSECEQSGLPMVRFDFFDMNRNPLAPVDALTVTAAETDSILINLLSSSSYFQLPLNYTENYTEFYLYFGSAFDPEDPGPASDTIRVYYENRPFFISLECGTAVFQDLESIEYTTNSFDSIAIIDRNVTKDETSHIHIFVNQ